MLRSPGFRLKAVPIGKLQFLLHLWAAPVYSAALFYVD
jgi:hypothetical protein